MNLKKLLAFFVCAGLLASVSAHSNEVNLQTENADYIFGSFKDKIKSLSSSTKSKIKSLFGTDDSEKVCQEVMKQYLTKTSFDGTYLPSLVCPYSWRTSNYTSQKDCEADKIPIYESLVGCYY